MFASNKIYLMRVLLCLILGAILFSCKVQLSEVEQHFGGKLDGELIPGYSYINHTKKEGVKPVEGDYAYFNYYFRLKDSLLHTNAAANRPEKMKIPTADEKVMPQMQPMHSAFKQMTIGDSLSFFIHIDSFPNKPPNLGDAKYVTQTFVLMDIKSADEYTADMEKERVMKEAKAKIFKEREAEIASAVVATAKQYTGGKLDAQIKTTNTGLKYIIHSKGEGPLPEKGNNVEVQYYGALTNGQGFDNSFKRGDTFKFPLGMGRVIKGWDEGIALLNEGSKATFFVPSHLAYGKAGAPPTIPEDAELIFYVELDNAKAQ